MTTVQDLIKELRNALNEAKDYAPHVTRNKNLIKEADALIDSSALEAQATEIERANYNKDTWYKRFEEAAKERDALQSKLDAMQAMEPFGYVSEHSCEGPYRFQFHKITEEVYFDNCKSITAVYIHHKVAEPTSLPKEYRRGTRLVSLQTQEHAVVKIVGRTTCVIEWTDGSVGEYTSQQLDENFGFADHGIDAECIRHSFDGYGWKYVDSGCGSDWYARGMEFEDAQPMYVDRPFPSSKVAEPLTVNCDKCVYHYKDVDMKPCSSCVHGAELTDNFEPRIGITKGQP